MTRNEYNEYLDKYIEDDNYYEKKMLDNHSDYCKISDLAKRFISTDKEYNHTDWNLTQILANIRMTEYESFDNIISKIEEEIGKYQEYDTPKNEYEQGFEEGCERGLLVALNILNSFKGEI